MRSRRIGRSTGNTGPTLLPDAEKSALPEGRKHLGDDNTLSSAFLLTYGECRILLGGDVTNLTWATILRNKLPKRLACKAVKASHHGSLDGNFPGAESLFPSLRDGKTPPAVVISGDIATSSRTRRP